MTEIFKKKSTVEHFVKSVQIRTCFWSECGKIRTRKNPVFGRFSRSGGGIIFDLVRKLFELSLLKITDESVAKQEKFQILFEEFVTAW